MANTATQRKQKVKSTATQVAVLRQSNRTNTSASAATVDVNKPLTDKQHAFALALGQGDSIPAAIIRAGFADSSTTFGYRMAKMPNIQAAVAFERARFEQQNKIKRQDVFDMLKDAFDTAKLMSEPASMVAAAREIGKMAGYYEPQKKVIDINLNTGKGTVAELSRMSDEQLIEVVEKAAAALAAAEQLALDHVDDDDDLDDPA